MPCTGGMNEVNADWYRAQRTKTSEQNFFSGSWHALNPTNEVRSGSGRALNSHAEIFFDWCKTEDPRKMIMYFVYVLISDFDGKFYIGFTNNVTQRLKDHNSGKVSSTSSRRPFRIIYYEAHLCKTDALRREQYFKTSKGKTTLKQMLRDSLAKQNL